VSALIFFLLGVPLALIADRLIARFDAAAARDDADVALESSEEAEQIEAKRLPWQNAPWSDRLRRSIVLFLPALTAVAGWRFDAVDAIAVSLIVAALLICTATDLLRYRVPNAITYPGTLLALLAALVLSPETADILNALLAAALAGLFFFIMALATRGGIGLGDVKLAMLIGAVLGLQASYIALLLGVVAAGAVIFVLVLLRLIGRRQAIPYAPFLALAAVGVLLTQGPVFVPI